MVSAVNRYYQYNCRLLPEIRLADTAAIEPPYLHKKRTPGEYIFYLIRRGEMYLSENEILYHLLPGDLLILDPDRTHVGRKATCCEYYYVHFQYESLKPVELTDDALREALETFGTHADQEWLVFTSPAGADLFFDQLMELGMDLRSLLVRGAEVRIAAIGSGTAAALRKRGLIPDLVPRVYSAAALGEALAETAAEGSRITVARAEKGSEELLPPLLKAGLDVDDIPLYRTLYETHHLLKDRIRELLEQGRIDAVTFTSASTVRGFTGAVECADYTGIRAVCIGEQTAAEAAKYGMQIQVSDQASMDAMVGKIVELFGKDSGQ